MRVCLACMLLCWILPVVEFVASAWDSAPAYSFYEFIASAWSYGFSLAYSLSFGESVEIAPSRTRMFGMSEAELAQFCANIPDRCRCGVYVPDSWGLGATVFPFEAGCVLNDDPFDLDAGALKKCEVNRESRNIFYVSRHDRSNLWFLDVIVLIGRWLVREDFSEREDLQKILITIISISVHPRILTEGARVHGDRAQVRTSVFVGHMINGCRGDKSVRIFMKDSGSASRKQEMSSCRVGILRQHYPQDEC